MKLIVGLGNPGREYERTRHNFGFMVIDKLASQLGCKADSQQAGALVARANLAGQPVMLAKPQTMMNRSGSSVARLSEKLALTDPQDLIIVCDEVALPLGMIRIRPKGSAGGHNGLKSVIECIHTNQFIRLRLGIGPADDRPNEMADFVLSNFRPAEKPVVNEVAERSCEALVTIVTDGVVRAMQRYNEKVKEG